MLTATVATMTEMAHSGGTRILVVDDEPSIVDAVATALRYEGYEVEEATTGREALEAVVRTEPDLVVLDWMLPDIEGIEVGRRLRGRGFDTAILFLTAKDATENKVEALRAGGDDYVTKPFSLAEIVARVQAILRRTGGDLPGDVLSFADIVLDEGAPRGAPRRHPDRPDGDRVQPPALLLAQPRRVLSKGQILQNVWRYDFGGNANVVETYVSYLRRKLHAAGPPVIKTVRQAGYMLDVGSGEMPKPLMRRPLSLRARLVLAVIALATVGLAVANVVTYTSLRSFLLDRTDQELRESTGGIARELDHGCPGRRAPGARRLPRTTIQLRSEDGSVFCTLQATASVRRCRPGRTYRRRSPPRLGRGRGRSDRSRWTRSRETSATACRSRTSGRGC